MDSTFPSKVIADTTPELKNSSSAFLISTADSIKFGPSYANNTGILNTYGQESSFDTIGLVVIGVAGIIVVMSVLIVVFLRPCLQPARLFGTPACGGKRASVEQALSKQIVDIERFQVLDSPHKDASASTCELAMDSTYVKTTSTQDKHLHLYDPIYDIEPDSDLGWGGQSDLDRQSVSSCRTWLLDNVDILDVIVEEPEDVLSHGSTSSASSPCSRNNGNFGGGSELHSSNDSGSLFQSCSDGSSGCILDMAFSESTTTEYKTCNESQANRNGIDQCLTPGQGRVKDESHSSGTSGEVSSGCFDDLSYVTFHTLPTSAYEDLGLQPLYECFDPKIRIESSTCKHASLTSPTKPLLQSSGC